jgi:hypothetical protein
MELFVPLHANNLKQPAENATRHNQQNKITIENDLITMSGRVWAENETFERAFAQLEKDLRATIS